MWGTNVRLHYRLSYGGIYCKTPERVYALCWHLPIFTGRRQPTIFGTTELNFCVRYGNRWTLSVINTNYYSLLFKFYALRFPFMNFLGDSCGNRTRVAGVRGRSLNRLTNEPFVFNTRANGPFHQPLYPFLVHHQGLEPGTPWLRVRCSTNWANGAYLSLCFQHPENWIKVWKKEKEK